MGGCVLQGKAKEADARQGTELQKSAQKTANFITAKPSLLHGHIFVYFCTVQRNQDPLTTA